MLFPNPFLFELWLCLWMDDGKDNWFRPQYTSSVFCLLKMNLCTNSFFHNILYKTRSLKLDFKIMVFHYSGYYNCRIDYNINNNIILYSYIILQKQKMCSKLSMLGLVHLLRTETEKDPMNVIFRIRLTLTDKNLGTWGLSQAQHRCSAESSPPHVQLLVHQQHVWLAEVLCSSTFHRAQCVWGVKTNRGFFSKSKNARKRSKQLHC